MFRREALKLFGGMFGGAVIGGYHTIVKPSTALALPTDHVGKVLEGKAALEAVKAGVKEHKAEAPLHEPDESGDRRCWYRWSSHDGQGLGVFAVLHTREIRLHMSNIWKMHPQAQITHSNMTSDQFCDSFRWGIGQPTVKLGKGDRGG